MKFVKKKVLTDNQAQEIDNEFDNIDVFNFDNFGEDFENKLNLVEKPINQEK